MVHEEILRREALTRIRDGRLPAYVPTRAWGGPGTGEACALCNRAIARDDTQIELRFDDERHPLLIRFHPACHAAWEVVREQI